MTSDVRIDIDLEARGSARVVLIGFMGAGKTTVARRWADAGGPVVWFDSDDAALRLLGVDSVEQAFREVGERGWRDAEREVVLQRAAPLRRGLEVWSLGGGSVCDSEIQRAILDSTVVWLDAPIDVLWERVSAAADAGQRPLATSREAFARLYEERSSLYESLATCHVNTAGDLSEIGLGRILAEQLPPAWFGSGLAIGRGLLRRVHELTALSGTPVALVADQNVDELASSVARRLAEAGIQLVSDQRLAMGEWNKQLSTVEHLLREWAGARLHRGGTVVAIGGGTLLDTAGFAASVYHRGVNWVSIPTTVTSQVDAGVGGKTGVNMGAVKNVVGAVHQPLATVIDPLALAGLGPDLVREGFVEAAKTALLAGEPLLGAARAVAREIATGEVPSSNGSGPQASAAGRSEAWLSLVDGCAAYKDTVVGEDPFDTDGIRAQLNLGHTLGHAIEAATGGAVSHGAAVAVGIAAALELSVRELQAPHELVTLWRELCEPLGIGLRSSLAWDVVEPFLVHDKKRDSHGLGWALVSGLGRPVTEVRIPMDRVQAVWEECIHEPAAAPLRAAGSADPRVLVLFGANLGELGRREVGHYGSDTLPVLVEQVERWAAERGLVADCRQTDSLERFLGALHEARTSHAAVIVNPGAWTHYERALHDAIEPLPMPVVEVHLSDVRAREEWRHESVIAPVVARTISGRGADGYAEALTWLAGELGLPAPRT